MKNEISASDNLARRIRELEMRQEHQIADLKSDFEELGESLNPKNMIKAAMRTVVSTPGLKATTLDTAISLGAGFLGRKLVVRKSGNFFRKIAGTAVQFVLTNIVRNKIPELKKDLYKQNGVQ